IRVCLILFPPELLKLPTAQTSLSKSADTPERTLFDTDVVLGLGLGTMVQIEPLADTGCPPAIPTTTRTPARTRMRACLQRTPDSIFATSLPFSLRVSCAHASGIRGRVTEATNDAGAVTLRV